MRGVLLGAQQLGQLRPRARNRDAQPDGRGARRSQGGAGERRAHAEVQKNLRRARDGLADYVIDGEKFSSFFELDGTFVATTAAVKLQEIPVKIRKNIQAKLGSKEIRNIVHYATETEIAYFVETLEYGKEKVYRVGSNGSISRFK